MRIKQTHSVHTGTVSFKTFLIKLIIMSGESESAYKRSEEERLNLFFDFVKYFRDSDQLHYKSVRKAIVHKADDLKVTDKAPVILVELLLLDIKSDYYQHIKEVAPLFKPFTVKNMRGQRYFLRGFEQAVQRNTDTFLPKISAFLTVFYDHDILEAATLLHWWQNISIGLISPLLAATIRQNATPVIAYLRSFLQSTCVHNNDLQPKYPQTQPTHTRNFIV